VLVLVGATSCGVYPATRQVDLRSFEIDADKVSVDDYRACVHQGVCEPPAENGKICECGDGNFQVPNNICCQSDRCLWNELGGPNGQAVNCVSYDQAVDYCRWRGKRLPTPEEWEYAALRAAEPSPTVEEPDCSRGPGGPASDIGALGMWSTPCEFTTGRAEDYFEEEDGYVLKGITPNLIHVAPYRKWFTSSDDFWSPDVGFRCAAW
jgi:hypothetical protein